MPSHGSARRTAAVIKRGMHDQAGLVRDQANPINCDAARLIHIKTPLGSDGRTGRPRGAISFGYVRIGAGVVGVVNARGYGVTDRCERSSIRGKCGRGAGRRLGQPDGGTGRSRSGRRQHRRPRAPAPTVGAWRSVSGWLIFLAVFRWSPTWVSGCRRAWRCARAWLRLRWPGAPIWARTTFVTRSTPPCCCTSAAWPWPTSRRPRSATTSPSTGPWPAPTWPIPTTSWRRLCPR